MTRTTPGRVLRATPAAILIALALPLSVSAAQRAAAAHGSTARQAGATFAFGRSGGNIAPTRIVIARTGRITATGEPRHAAAISTDAVAGLLALARAEHFFTMPRARTCSSGNPDFAGNYITVSTPSASRTVSVRGSCNVPFRQLYGVLSAAAGVG